MQRKREREREKVNLKANLFSVRECRIAVRMFSVGLPYFCLALVITSTFVLVVALVLLSFALQPDFFRRS
jgi:hypothetical protein